VRREDDTRSAAEPQGAKRTVAYGNVDGLHGQGHPLSVRAGT
jgi:hypothetical protein